MIWNYFTSNEDPIINYERVFSENCLRVDMMVDHKRKIGVLFLTFGHFDEGCVILARNDCYKFFTSDDVCVLSIH